MNLYRQLIVISVLLPAGFSSGALSQEKLQMEGTSIIGNKELPNVLYILPWKSTEQFNIENPPITSIMDQKLKPIKRKAFRRRVNYYEATVSAASKKDK